MDGVVVVDKAEGWTSHDVVGKFRGIARTRKVGHLGTLDPIATGVLPLIVGQATRLARFYTRADKTYEATIRFGFATDTYDRAGAPTSEAVRVTSRSAWSRHRVATLSAARFEQMPPQYSAKKVDGVRGLSNPRARTSWSSCLRWKWMFTELDDSGFAGPDLRVARASALAAPMSVPLRMI